MHFWALGDKKRKEKYSAFLDNYASGLSTSRDAWVYSFSDDKALMNANNMISFYNAERERCHSEFAQRVNEGVVTDDANVKQTYLQNIRSNDETKISWSAGLFSQFAKNKLIEYTKECKVVAYRPFCKKQLAYNKEIIERPSRWDSIFPDNEHPNLVMCVSGAPIKKGFSVLMTDTIQDLHFLENSQSFPLYFYEKNEKQEGAQLTFEDLLIEETAPTYKKRNAISDAFLKRFREVYGSRVEKEDIFYYLYALFHSPKYIELYGDNLSKEMPRIPTLNHFLDYVKVGKQLSALHVGYETAVDPISLGLTIQIEKEDYSVDKLRFKKDGQTIKKDTIIFNNNIVISNIPERAYEYIVNGKSPIEWLMERYAVTVDKTSGIVDDPNLYSDDPKYIFNLLISLIHVSLKTLDIIDTLPEYKEI
jgi:predicted helicase